MTRWAVGNVRTGDEVGRDYRTEEEIGVAVRLRGQGLRVWCPCYKATVRKWRRRRPREAVKALLPGYLFVDYDSIRDLEAVYDVPGFHYFLRSEGEVAMLPDSAVADLRALEKQGITLPSGLDVLVERFMAGTLVKVTDGPFGGWRGLVMRDRKGQVKITGGDFKHPTEFPAELLEAS